MKDCITVLLKIQDMKQHDLIIPEDITVKELLEAIIKGYDLQLDVTESQCFLISENPIALLMGTEKLSTYGIHNGTIINLMW